MSLSGYHSSDSDGHFDTPEAVTPVRAPPAIPGELENNNIDADKTGEATAEHITQTERQTRGREHTVQDTDATTPVAN